MDKYFKLIFIAFHIKNINLYCNKLDDSCIISLGEYLIDNQTLDFIGIGSNQITDKGIEILTPYLIGNKTLRYLDISSNMNISDTSIKFLSQIIDSSSIENINVSGTSITRGSVFSAVLINNLIKNKSKIINFYDT